MVSKTGEDLTSSSIRTKYNCLKSSLDTQISDLAVHYISTKLNLYLLYNCGKSFYKQIYPSTCHDFHHISSNFVEGSPLFYDPTCLNKLTALLCNFLHLKDLQSFELS